MFAFVEHLCEHCGLVRAGPEARGLGDPYLYSVTYVLRGEYAEPVGFDQGRIPLSVFHAIIEAINETTGKLVAYDRIGRTTRRFEQCPLGDTGGRIMFACK